MIVAPINPNQACLASDSAATAVGNGEGCYKFVAYYPVIRTKVTRGELSNSTTSDELLDSNPNESGRWVIMELRVNLVAQTGTVPWNRVGCDKRSTPCSSPPSIDPIRASATLPVLTCTLRCSGSGRPRTAEVSDFKTKMNATVAWLNINLVNVKPEILIEGIDETYRSSIPGFRVQMNNESRDARGITEVRMSLRGRIGDSIYGSGGNAPINFFFTPRNIAPLKPSAP